MDAGASGVTINLCRWSAVHLARSTDGAYPNTIEVTSDDSFEQIGGYATPEQARQLAAALVALADEIERQQ